jgi:hypothetical protein
MQVANCITLAGIFNQYFLHLDKELLCTNSKFSPCTEEKCSRNSSKVDVAVHTVYRKPSSLVLRGKGRSFKSKEERI